jgi:hypothetical protein
MEVPQRLKRQSKYDVYDTAEAVSFHNRFKRQHQPRAAMSPSTIPDTIKYSFLLLPTVPA